MAEVIQPGLRLTFQKDERFLGPVWQNSWNILRKEVPSRQRARKWECPIPKDGRS